MDGNWQVRNCSELAINRTRHMKDNWHMKTNARNTQFFCRHIALLIDTIDTLDCWKELARKHEPHDGPINPYAGILQPSLPNNAHLSLMVRDHDSMASTPLAWGTEIYQHGGPLHEGKDGWMQHDH